MDCGSGDKIQLGSLLVFKGNFNHKGMREQWGGWMEAMRVE